MILEKDGITQDLENPQEIARYKTLGYKEVKPIEKPVSKMSVPELKAEAEKRGLSDFEDLLKPELLEILSE